MPSDYDLHNTNNLLGKQYNPTNSLVIDDNEVNSPLYLTLLDSSATSAVISLFAKVNFAPIGIPIFLKLIRGFLFVLAASNTSTAFVSVTAVVAISIYISSKLYCVPLGLYYDRGAHIQT